MLSSSNVEKRRKKYHPVADSTLKREIYTSDPANIEYILKTNFDNYGKGKLHHEVLEDYYGDGVFAVDGDKWKEQRKLSSPDFSKRVLRDVNSIIFRRNAAKLANILNEAANSNNTVDIQLESVCHSSKEDSNRFIRAFDEVSELSFWRYIDLFWKNKKVLNVGSEAKLKRSVQIIDEVTITVFINVDSSIVQQTKEENILSRFWHYSTTNPKYLRDILVNFMGGGKDSTGTTLAWFIWSLCKHPLHEKVASNIGTTISDFASHLNEEAMDKMHYLQAVLSETLRLYPSIPLLYGKVCFEDDVLPDGFNVNKGDMVVYQPYAMGRMKYIWGDDAEEFKPERWIDENGFFKQESPFKFTVFQAGPRICIGKEFAYKQMKITAAVLLRFFIFKLADESRPVTYKTKIQLHIAGGLHVRAMQRIDQN
ncbi:hypothetical protein R3W88_032040 [Solanum pinnatisectum]|uniref:Cytochrome P450 n=1 Tax=Solanum pinnatisectum TaxID=50273 RepID=A0AAV9LP21_9SOLN|nr:hypothetical protein R3W88_032040 [Solanum pinnatisectum]